MSQSSPENACVSDGSILEPILFLLTTDLLTKPHPIHSFADDATFLCPPSYRILRHPNTNIDRVRCVEKVFLNSIPSWGSNDYDIHVFKTSLSTFFETSLIPPTPVLIYRVCILHTSSLLSAYLFIAQVLVHISPCFSRCATASFLFHPISSNMHTSKRLRT